LEVNTIFEFIKRFLSIISPFFQGFLIAYVLNIPCGGMQKLLAKTKNSFLIKRKKLISIIITYLLLFFIIFLIIRLVIPSIMSSVEFFLTNFQSYYIGTQDIVHYINNMDIFGIDISMENITTFIRNFVIENLSLSINTIIGIPSALFKGFLAFVSSIYCLIEKDRLTAYLCKLLKVFSSDTVYHTVLKYTRLLNNNFKQYIYTQTIDGCILGSLATIELILLRSPYALILGILLGIVNYIPYFGSIFGSIFAVIIVAFTQGLPTAAIASIVLLITQQLDGNVIQPKLLGGSFSLSPLLVIICITIGGAYYGILGMIVAIPIIAVVKNILEEIVAHYDQQKKIKYNDMQPIE